MRHIFYIFVPIDTILNLDIDVDIDVTCERTFSIPVWRIFCKEKGNHREFHIYQSVAAPV